MTRLEVQTANFGNALKKYLTLTSKTAEEALNGKAYDLYASATKKTPLGKTKSQIRAGIRDVRAVAIWRRCRQHSIPFPPGRSAPFSTLDIINSMKRVGSGKGYMKSGFAKTRNLFPRTQASKLRDNTRAQDSFRTTAYAMVAYTNHLMAKGETGWPGDGDGGKQRIVDRAITSALIEVRADMEKYFVDKLKRQALEVSGK